MRISELRRKMEERRGSSSVEFLFGVMFVAILMIGFLEMGRAIHYYQVLTDGARSGGRYLTRVENPCDPDAIQEALGLVITRSADWSRPPIFTDWPNLADLPDDISSYDFSFNNAEHFEVEMQGCDSGEIADYNFDSKVILFVKYQYRDYLGLLAFLGLQEGFWIVGRHEELHVGG